MLRSSYAQKKNTERMASSNEMDSSNSPSISPYISDITDEEDGEIKSGGCYLNEPEYNQEELLKIQNHKTPR